MCFVYIANNINRNVYMYQNTRIFITTGYARVLLFMFIRRELGGTGTGCLFQFTYCDYTNGKVTTSLYEAEKKAEQARLSLHLSKWHIVRNHMSRLI